MWESVCERVCVNCCSPVNITSQLSKQSYIELKSPLHIFLFFHDDVIKWKHFPHYCPYVRGIHRTPVNSPHKGQWRGALMFFFVICAWINGWVNNREAGVLRRHYAHYVVIVLLYLCYCSLAACCYHCLYTLATTKIPIVSVRPTCCLVYCCTTFCVGCFFSCCYENKRTHVVW